MEMDVEDPTAFVNDERSAGAMAVAVAEMAGDSVDAGDVRVELSVGTRSSRRLLSVERRLETEYVIIDADITVEDTAAADGLQTTLDLVTPEMMTNSTLDALEAAGWDTTDLGLEITLTATSISLPPAPAPAPSGQASAASLRWKACSLAPFFAVSAWLLSNV